MLDHCCCQRLTRHTHTHTYQAAQEQHLGHPWWQWQLSDDLAQRCEGLSLGREAMKRDEEVEGLCYSERIGWVESLSYKANQYERIKDERDKCTLANKYN